MSFYIAGNFIPKYYMYIFSVHHLCLFSFKQKSDKLDRLEISKVEVVSILKWDTGLPRGVL